LQLINATKRTGKAKEIILVMPDYPCARQDKTHAMRECISARLVADLFDKAGLDDIITIDLHSEQIEGFFKSVDHLKMTPIFADYLKKRYDKLTKKFNLKGDYSDLVVVAPDEGGLRSANDFAKRIGENVEVAFAKQQRKRNVIHKKKIYGLVGDVKNKIVVSYDDILATGSTMFNVAKAVKQGGAKYMFGLCTHALGFDDKDEDNKIIKTFGQKLDESDIDELVVTNSRPEFYECVLKDELLQKKTNVISIAKYLAEAIKRSKKGETIREMMRNIEIEDLYEEIYEAKQEK